MARHRGSAEAGARPKRAHRPPLGAHEGCAVVPRLRTNPTCTVEHVAPRRRACQGQPACDGLAANGLAGLASGERVREEVRGGGRRLGWTRPQPLLRRPPLPGNERPERTSRGAIADPGDFPIEARRLCYTRAWRLFTKRRRFALTHCGSLLLRQCRRFQTPVLIASPGPRESGDRCTRRSHSVAGQTRSRRSVRATRQVGARPA